MRIEMFHPMMVHFTVGLLVAGVLMALVGSGRPGRWGMWWVSLADAGKRAIQIGAGFGILAVITGLIADDRLVEDAAIGELVDTHETLAFITLSVFAALAIGWLVYDLTLWRWARAKGKADPSQADQLELARLKRWPRWLHLLGVIGVGFILATAYYGGEMVYNHGAAVYRDGKPVVPATQPSGSPAPRSDAAPSMDRVPLAACPPVSP